MNSRLLAVMLGVIPGGLAMAQDEIRPERVAEIAAMLPDAPARLGPAITDRAA